MENINVNDINIGASVRQKMAEQGTTLAWLARQVGSDKGNLHRILQNNHIYPELLIKISFALKTDFFNAYSEFIKHKGL